MDIKRFLKLFKKYVWILILVPLLAATITYFLSKNLPKEYKSDAQISTGLVDASKQLSSQAQNDYFKTSQQFSNIIEKMKMRKMISILSYKLILHDLQDPAKSFRKYSPKIDSLSAADKQGVIQAYQLKLAEKSPITVYDNDGKYKLYDIISSMSYDQGNLNEKLGIYRPDNSDFVNIEFISESALLSAFVVNTLAYEFINNYGIEVYANQNESILLLDSLLKKKELEMNAKNNELKNFKMKNGVLNLDAQSATVYAQISQYEERKAQALQDIQANQGALRAINAKLGANGDPYLGGNAVVQNNAIIDLKNEIKIANDRYIDGNFKPADKRRVDSLQRILSSQSLRISEKNVVDPQVAKQGLIQQKINLEIATEQIKNTINSINKELNSLKAQYSTMVPFDAGIQNYERDAEVATKDYMAALDRTNQGRTEQNMGLKLQMAQIGLPGVAQPSKTLIYVGLSGVASFMFCLVGLIALFVMDTAIYSPAQLAKETGGPVFGTLNYIRSDVKDPRSIWNGTEDNVDYKAYKDHLRSLRFEIAELIQGKDCQIIGITGLNEGEGKTYLASSLTYAFAMTGKKILMISSKEEDLLNGVSQKMIPQEFAETFVVRKEQQTEDLITVFSNRTQNSSLLETQSFENLRNGFDELKKEFDLILIDINSLKEKNKAKEWLHFTDRSLAVFEYGKKIADEEQELVAYIRKQPGFIGWVLNKVKEQK